MIFVALLLIRYSTSERASLEEQAVATAVRTAAEVDRELASLITILDTLAAAPSLVRGDFREFHIQATSALTSRKLYVALINADDGQQLVNTRVPFGTPLPSSAILEREARHLMLEGGRPYVSDLVSGIVAQRPILGVAVPVRQGDTTPYMLVIAFDPEHLVGILRQSELPHGWAAGVVDRAGITIARSQLHEERVGKPMRPDARREALGERGVAVVTNFQGQTMFYSQARSKLSGWLIWTNVPTRIIDAELRNTFWILTAMGFSVALFSIVLAFAFGRRMAQPIQLAAQEAKSLGLGQAIRPSTSPLREANELMDALHSASREINDRTNALADEMRRREEAQAALLVAQRREAFGQLAAGIAHDFNNILTVILGNNELLENRLGDQNGRELLRRSTNAAEMGASLTRRLLTFARQQPRTPILIDLNDRVLAMVELLRGSLSANIELSTKLAKDVGMTTADPSEVENAIMNLAINARDAMPNGGKLTFETRSVVVDEAQGLEPGNYVVLSVSDTGQGMAPEIVARVFEPFFTTKGAQRTGLGLATIYGFVKQSGGNVTIHSELGHGTTVALWLPIAKVSAEAVKQDH